MTSRALEGRRRVSWPGLLAAALLFTLGVQEVPGSATEAVDPHFEALDMLAPGEQHRQLSLMLLVSAGVDDAMRQALAPLLDPGVDAGPGDTAGEGTRRTFRPEDYTTPLARIVDQRTLLAGAARLFHFVGENEATLRARLDALEAGGAEGEGRPGGALDTITEDTILIRKAIADSMTAVGLEGAGETAALRYREQTVVLRNALEYAQFKAELDVITDRAIASVGGKLDAYQRMFDDETNTGTFDRQIRSAELIYLPEGQFDPRAGVLTEEMLRNMVLMESNPNR